MVRLALTVLENLQIADASKREALTDALTGLGNRRRLMVDVEATLADARTSAAILVLYDLDGFKGYNDTFGHPAGDALLTRLGGTLAEAVAAVRHGLPAGRRRVLRAARWSTRRARRRDRGHGGARCRERGGGFSVKRLLRLRRRPATRRAT